MSAGVGRRGVAYCAIDNSVVSPLHSIDDTSTIALLWLNVSTRYSIHLTACRGRRLLEWEVKKIL